MSFKRVDQYAATRFPHVRPVTSEALKFKGANGSHVTKITEYPTELESLVNGITIGYLSIHSLPEMLQYTNLVRFALYVDVQ
jgi:hypothetical protein